MIRRLFSLVCVASVLGTATSFAAQPEVKWEYEGLSNLYPPPLVADMAPDSGLETIIVNAEARRVRCIDCASQIIDRVVLMRPYSIHSGDGIQHWVHRARRYLSS